jgi:Ca2+-binding EF-hand superfamily protein
MWIMHTSMRAAVVAFLGTVLAVGLVALYKAKAGSGAGNSQATSTNSAADGSPGDGGANAPPRTADELALAELNEELGKAEPVSFRSDEQRLAEARAWVLANHPVNRHYNELEAKMLALFDAILDGEERSALWVLNQQQIEVESMRALDADGDGQVSDEEVFAFTDEGLGGFDPFTHPYMVAKLDTDGDGELSREEALRLASMSATRGAMAGVIERAELEGWDADRDGFVSEGERVAGQAAARERVKLFPDGHMEFVDDPAAIDAGEQAAVRVKIAEQFGEEALAMMEAKFEQSASQVIAQPLLEAMRVENADQREVQQRMTELTPSPPDPADYDTDGDGAPDSARQAEYQTAIQAYQTEMQDWAAMGRAMMLRIEFGHAAAQSDTDSDGRMSATEWEERIDQLLAEREERLFLRSYDLDGSGRVEAGELAQFLEWYRGGSPRADFNFDGALDARDLEQMASRFQQQG